MNPSTQKCGVVRGACFSKPHLRKHTLAQETNEKLDTGHKKTYPKLTVTCHSENMDIYDFIAAVLLFLPEDECQKQRSWCPPPARDTVMSASLLL